MLFFLFGIGVDDLCRFVFDGICDGLGMLFFDQLVFFVYWIGFNDLILCREGNVFDFKLFGDVVVVCFFVGFECLCVVYDKVDDGGLYLVYVYDVLVVFLVGCQGVGVGYVVVVELVVYVVGFGGG